MNLNKHLVPIDQSFGIIRQKSYHLSFISCFYCHLQVLEFLDDIILKFSKMGVKNDIKKMRCFGCFLLKTRFQEQVLNVICISFYFPPDFRTETVSKNDNKWILNFCFSYLYFIPEN